MGRVTLRGLEGPHIIVSTKTGQEQVTLLNTPTITLPDGTHEIEIYKCKARHFDRKNNKDVYDKGELLTKLVIIIPDEKTVYV